MSLALLWVVSVRAAEPTLHTVSSVDLDRYSGQWFAVAVLRNSFQRFCIDQTRAEYEREGNIVRVKNECHSWLFGVNWSLSGRARAVDASKSKLQVKFRGKEFEENEPANYWILGLGENYEWVLVGVPERNQGWLMVRDPKQSDAAFLNAEPLLKRNGYDACDFKLEPQKGFDVDRSESLCLHVKEIQALARAKKEVPPLVKQVATNLQSALMKAIAERGPVEALSFCNENALPLTHEKISQNRTVLSLKRTSLKVRNPKNAPDSRERRVLKEWGERKEPLFEADIQKERVHAYFPIYVQPQCVLCHGKKTALLPELSAKLDTLYPDDKATGYEPGMFRGVFHVEVPF